MADDEALRDWLKGVAERHGLGTDGSVATAQDADDDPLAEYERLGGDAALLKVLAAEDQLFRTELEKKRAVAQDWQKDRRRELLDAKDFLEQQLKRVGAEVTRWQGWHAHEAKVVGPIEETARSAGAEKLATEAGKELLHLIEQRRDKFDYIEHALKRDRNWLERARPGLELLERRLQDVDRTYEAVEQRIRDTRTELDNVLQLEAMSLDEKIERLRAGSGKARAAAQEKLDEELSRVFEEGAAEDKDEFVFYSSPWGDYEPEPIDWKPVDRKLGEVLATPVENLRKADPELEKIRVKYEKAGGDEALFEKRMKDWKTMMQALSYRDKAAMSSEATSEAELQSRLVEAKLAAKQVREELSQLRSKRDRAQARRQELAAGASKGDLLSERESAEMQLLTRDLERIDKEIANTEKLARVHARSAENAAKLIEQQRREHEHDVDDDALVRPVKPRSGDLHDIPLRAKYEELTQPD